MIYEYYLFYLMLTYGVGVPFTIPPRYQMGLKHGFESLPVPLLIPGIGAVMVPTLFPESGVVAF